MSKDVSCFWWDFAYCSWGFRAWLARLGVFFGFFTALGTASFVPWAISELIKVF